MKKAILLIFSVLISILSYSQVLNQDAKGNSTILFNGSTIGMDIQDASASFALNNFRNQNITDSAKKMMYGLTFKVKNNDGVADMFTQGNFNPESKITGIIGHSWYSDNKLYFQRMKNLLRSKTDKLDNLTNNFIDERKKRIDSIKVAPASNVNELKDLKEELIKLTDNVPLVDLSDKISTVAKKYINYYDTIEIISLTTTTKYSEYKSAKQNIEKEIKTAETEFKTLGNFTYKRWTVYFTGSLISSFFKLQNAIDTSNFSNSFKNHAFYGYDFDLGGNCQIGGKWIFGAALGIQQNNNLDNLSKKEYTLRTVTANSTQQLSTEKKITAFSGDYQTFSQTKISVDAVHFFKIGKADIIALNLYVRQFFPLKKDKPAEITNAGLSSYLFKNSGKFIGGVYIEFPDLFNNTERGNGTIELKPFEKRISTGVVAKIALNSIFAY